MLNKKQNNLNLKLSDFDYYLPNELIAQKPLENRDESRLLVLNKIFRSIEHRKFSNIIDYLSSDDIIVYNDTKVIPARLIGKKENGSEIELLLIEQLDNNIWLCMVKPGKKAKPGSIIHFENNIMHCEILKSTSEGYREVRFYYEGDWWEILNKIGKTPLPPYIKRSSSELELLDKEKYQTVFAKMKGSSAAPTAGLHFSNELLKAIEKKGVCLTSITLHIGPGTFQPVKVEDISKHKMHPEWFKISEETAYIIKKGKQSGKRIIAVGTTTVRALESTVNESGSINPIESSTRLMIVPGYKFKIIDALITNFHLPKSTLLMLVCAFAGKDLIFNAYQEAIVKKYRFYSYGDAMFIF